MANEGIIIRSLGRRASRDELLRGRKLALAEHVAILPKGAPKNRHERRLRLAGEVPPTRNWWQRPKARDIVIGYIIPKKDDGPDAA